MALDAVHFLVPTQSNHIPTHHPVPSFVDITDRNMASVASHEGNEGLGALYRRAISGPWALSEAKVNVSGCLAEDDDRLCRQETGDLQRCCLSATCFRGIRIPSPR